MIIADHRYWLESGQSDKSLDFAIFIHYLTLLKSFHLYKPLFPHLLVEDKNNACLTKQ